jgi:aspartyl-tRNA(Asn)/glutamyl-tRNA(Gln) amidotransferase subunit B
MEFEPVIGLEVHSELSTDSKIFCGCSTQFGSKPNSQMCPVCMGLPGVLPVLNKKAMEYSVRIALALNCKITEFTKFDRKNYYYPDLPKNYQISQQYNCLGRNGYLKINVNGVEKNIGINNVHLEEDAGKLLHPEIPGADYSLVDLNRTGVPLIEIVSEPDMRSLDEMMAYMMALKNLLQYIEVSDCKMQEGSLRFEINVSVRPKGITELGKKVEIKNLNSMKIAMKAAEYEIVRQSKIIQKGGEVEQETRLWDDEKFITKTMRSKEESKDYRYFPEPDLVTIHITKEWQEEIRRNLPELQLAMKKRIMRVHNISEYDAEVVTRNRANAVFYVTTTEYFNKPKEIINLMETELFKHLNEKDIEIDDSKITPKQFANLVRLIDENIISGKIAKTVLQIMMETGKDPEDIIKEKGLIQITDESQIREVAKKVIQANPKPVKDYKGGKEKSFGFLIGQIMKETKGKANPELLNKILKEELSK